jgi:oligopeptide/dipeptide ABC transporter ATP-binding protein
MTTAEPTGPVLEVRDLNASFMTRRGEVRAVRDVSFSLQQGETLALVGESGSGKTATAMSILRMLPGTGRIGSGEIVFQGQDLLSLSQRKMSKIRGRRIGLIPQDPAASLNPLMTVGQHVTELLGVHLGMHGSEARQRTLELLDLVGIPEAGQRIDAYPHQLSGGMRQRVMIALALSCNPDIVIADEPTTALDVTIQAQILALLDNLRAEFDSAVILITHDLGVVASIAHDILVMYAGRVVESAPKRELFYDPQMPYTWGLLGSIPRLDRPKQEKLHSITGSPPSLINAPRGCKFRPRCPHVFDRCIEEPELVNRVEASDHLDRCWLSLDDKRRLRDETIAPEASIA